MVVIILNSQQIAHGIFLPGLFAANIADFSEKLNQMVNLLRNMIPSSTPFSGKFLMFTFIIDIDT